MVSEVRTMKEGYPSDLLSANLWLIVDVFEGKDIVTCGQMWPIQELEVLCLATS